MTTEAGSRLGAGLRRARAARTTPSSGSSATARPSGAQSGQHTGRTDIPLTEPGEEQARGAARLLADLRPALVLCSPRAARSATPRELAGLDVDEINDDLAEWDYGDYEGRTTPRSASTTRAGRS